jgi:hypothetical protein
MSDGEQNGATWASRLVGGRVVLPEPATTVVP